MKRGMDIVLVLGIGILAFLPMLWVALAVALTSRGPIEQAEVLSVRC